MSVLQSGSVTPQHLASWVTDGVLQDAGISLQSLNAIFTSVKQGINFNAGSTDFPIAVLLPAGFTRYRIHDIIVSGASGSLTNATGAVYTGTSGGGINVVAPTAMTISTNVPDQVNTMQVLAIVNQNTVAFQDTTLFFRVINPQGSTATANVTINYEPLP